MINKRVISGSVFLLFLVLAFAKVTANTSAAKAPSLAGGLEGCYNIFLPIVVGSGGGSETAQTVSSVVPMDDCVKETPDIVDFNGDGYADLAIGIATEDENALLADTGALQILYGTANGISAENNQFFTQADILSDQESGELFSTALTAGDFNGDGITDLAVGTPRESREGIKWTGEVNILFGVQGQGLTLTGIQTLAQGLNGVEGVAEELELFGEVLTSGDYNGDGYDDLAVASPEEELESEGLISVGMVNVLYGSPNGLQTENDILIHMGLPEVPGEASALDFFGRSLASADFNGDGFEELVVGIPNFDFEGLEDVGAIMVFSGSASGISLYSGTLWMQGDNGVTGAREDSDEFGTILAPGDFNADGISDLAVGTPRESVFYSGSDILFAGAVNILYGSANEGGLSGEGDQIFHQGLTNVFGQPGQLEYFGISLAAADFDGDGADDLAVGVPGESGTAQLQGYVQVFYGNGTGLVTTGQQLWTQGIITGAPEHQDFFGVSSSAGDFDGNGFADLIVGVPFEDVLVNGVDRVDVGAIHAIYGTPTGLSVLNNQIWHQESAGIPDVSELEDYFGFYLLR